MMMVMMAMAMAMAMMMITNGDSPWHGGNCDGGDDHHVGDYGFDTGYRHITIMTILMMMMMMMMMFVQALPPSVLPGPELESAPSLAPSSSDTPGASLSS